MITHYSHVEPLPERTWREPAKPMSLAAQLALITFAAAFVIAGVVYDAIRKKI